MMHRLHMLSPGALQPSLCQHRREGLDKRGKVSRISHRITLNMKINGNASCRQNAEITAAKKSEQLK